MSTHYSILAGNFHGQRNLVGYSPWGHKELDTTEHAHPHEVINWNGKEGELKTSLMWADSLKFRQSMHPSIHLFIH